MERNFRIRVLIDFDVKVPANLPGTPDAIKIRDGLGQTVLDMLAAHGVNNECVRASVSGVEIISDDESSTSSTSS